MHFLEVYRYVFEKLLTTFRLLRYLECTIFCLNRSTVLLLDSFNVSFLFNSSFCFTKFELINNQKMPNLDQSEISEAFVAMASLCTF